MKSSRKVRSHRPRRFSPRSGWQSSEADQICAVGKCKIDLSTSGSKGRIGPLDGPSKPKSRGGTAQKNTAHLTRRELWWRWTSSIKMVAATLAPSENPIKASNGPAFWINVRKERYARRNSCPVVVKGGQKLKVRWLELVSSAKASGFGGFAGRSPSMNTKSWSWLSCSRILKVCFLSICNVILNSDCNMQQG